MRAPCIPLRSARAALLGPVRHPAPRRLSSLRFGICVVQVQSRQANDGAATYDVVVCGGGAAGLAAAYFAASEGAKVLVLEKTLEAGSKILISGGTRCNVLPGSVDVASDYVTESSQSALRAVFSSWSLEEARQWLEDPSQVGVALALEESTNKLFPASNSAAEVREKLAAACVRRGVAFRFGADLESLRCCASVGGQQQQQRLLQRQQDSAQAGSPARAASGSGAGGSTAAGWECGLRGGEAVAARRVVLAMGGRSFPKLGTDGAGYGILSSLGHTLHEPYPALTPLLGGHPGGQQLAGISLSEAGLTAEPARGGGSGGGSKARRGGAARAARTALLFTHRGYSGPAAMDLSHHVTRAMTRGLPLPGLEVRWLAGVGAERWQALLTQRGSALTVAGVLRRQGLPQRLADALCEEAGAPRDRKVAELRKQERTALLEALSGYELPITGSEGYAKAEVTGGGVPLSQLDCSTLESRLAPGVHVCGELCDVFGRIGGFNFLWAWVSGRLAGLGAAHGLAEP